MYQKFDPALLSLMAVAKKVTPQGQPTVAANMLGQAGVPPQAMPPGQPPGQPPGMPPGMPPQGIAQAFPATPPQNMQGALDQSAAAAPSVAKNMQEQQTAQMLAQGQPQPPMMAEGGIASLPIDDYEYADGGIIGYAGGGTSDVGDEGSILRRLIDWMKSKKEEPQEPEPQPMVPMIANRGLEPTEPAPRQEVLREPPPAAPRPREGITSVLPPQDTAASLYTKEQEALKAREAAVQPAKTLDQIRAEKLAARKARGLPEDPTELARAQLTGIEALDAKRLALEEAQKAPRLQAGMLKGLLAPGAKTLGDVFRGSAEGILGAEEAERAGNISSLERQRREMTLTNEMKAAMQRAQYLELDGEFEESKKELDRALALKAKIEADRSSLRTGRRGELAEAEKSRAASEATARNYAASRQADPVYTQAYQAKLDQLVAEGGNPSDPKLRQAALEYALGQTKGYTSKERMSGDSTDVKRQALVAKNPAYKIASTMYAIETDPAKKAQHLATMEKIEADNNIGPSEPTAAPAQYAKNPKTGERIMSTDGGKTWNPV